MYGCVLCCELQSRIANLQILSENFCVPVTWVCTVLSPVPALEVDLRRLNRDFSKQNGLRTERASSLFSFVVWLSHQPHQGFAFTASHLEAHTAWTLGH